MRTHSQIIRDAGGALKVHDLLGLASKLNTVRSWYQRDKIPDEYWRAFADRKLATLDELATHAAVKARAAA